MNMQFRDMLERSPIIAAVFDPVDLPQAVESPCEAIFLLSGSIVELADMIALVRKANKKMYIHVDLLEGIGRDASAIKYVAAAFAPDGIITTKANIAKYAKECGLFVVQRFFMLDSKSFEGALRAVDNHNIDAIEILPGIIPSVLSTISASTAKPIIAGGLVRHKKEAIESLNAGAMAVSTSCKEIWYL